MPVRLVDTAGRTIGRLDWLLLLRKSAAWRVRPSLSRLKVHIHDPRACHSSRTSKLELQERRAVSCLYCLVLYRPTLDSLPCRLIRAAGALSSTFDRSVIPDLRDLSGLVPSFKRMHVQPIPDSLTFHSDLVFGRRQIITERSHYL